MRKEAKEAKRVNVNGQQGYHARTTSGNYASQGFTRPFAVRNSDRWIEADGTPKSYGFEWEMTSRIHQTRVLATIIEKCIYPLFPEGLFKQQSDGSLGGNSSTEVISMPMTKAYIRNAYNSFKAAYDFLAAIDTMPDDSCGMHVNISMPCFGATREKQEAAVLRLHNWMCDNYNFACALLKRSTSRTQYCGQMQRGTLGGGGAHCYMMNYAHMNEGAAARVEIRLVGPQKSFGSFRNTFEVVFHLVEAAKEGRDFGNVVRLFKGCNECVLDRLNDLRAMGYISDANYEAIKASSINAGIKAATLTR